MIKIEHFRSKLDVLFHVLISSFWLQTKISWFSARKFRGLFFEHLELNFRPSIFFSFSTDPKNLRNFKTRPATKWRYYWGSFYLRQITYQITVPDLIEPDSQCCSAATAWNWLQLLAIGWKCLQMVATAWNWLLPLEFGYIRLQSVAFALQIKLCSMNMGGTQILLCSQKHFQSWKISQFINYLYLMSSPLYLIDTKSSHARE